MKIQYLILILGLIILVPISYGMIIWDGGSQHIDCVSVNDCKALKCSKCSGDAKYLSEQGCIDGYCKCKYETCPAGQVCSNGNCVPKGTVCGNNVCESGETCPASSNDCSSGERCVNGVCQAGPPPTTIQQCSWCAGPDQCATSGCTWSEDNGYCSNAADGCCDCPSNGQPSCSCGGWKDVECGLGNCADNEMVQTRSCNPDGCRNERRCKVDLRCNDDLPTVSVTGAPSTWQNTEATADVNCDDGGANCDSSTFKLDISNSPISNCPSGYGQYDTNAPKKIQAHRWVCGAGKDYSGNLATSQTPVEFKVDQTNPSGEISINDGAQATNLLGVTLYLNYSDTGGSGVSDCRFRNDNTWSSNDPTEQWQPCTPTKDWILKDGDGTKTVDFQMRDAAGNNGNVVSDSITLDTVIPSVSVSHSPTSGITDTTTVDITATVSSPNSGSGLKNILVYVDNTLKKTCTSTPCYYATTYSSGTHTYYAEAYDNAENKGRDPATGTKSFTVGGYSITASPSSVKVLRRQVANYTVNVTSYDFTGTITLSQSGCPSATTCSFNTTSLSFTGTGSKYAKLTATPSSTAPYGAYTITVTATGGSTSKSAQVGLNISSIVGDFTISVVPLTEKIIPGRIANYTVDIASDGFSGTVNLAHKNCPSLATCSFNPSSLTFTGTGTKTSTFSIATQPTIALNNYSVIINATSGSEAKWATVNLSVRDKVYRLTIFPQGGEEVEPKMWVYEGNDYIWPVDVADESEGVTGRITYRFVFTRDGTCHGNTDLYNGTDDDNTQIKKGTGRRVVEFNITQNTAKERMFKVFVNRTGLSANHQCALILTIRDPNNEVVDPIFNVTPPPGGPTPCTPQSEDQVCEPYEKCEIPVGEPVGTCVDLRPGAIGCDYYDYCADGNDPVTGEPCPAPDFPDLTNWKEYCFTNSADPNEIAEIDRACRQSLSYRAHALRTCSGG